MRFPWIVLPAALAALLATTGCGEAEEADLVLFSPHSDEIEEAFEAGFRKWYKERTGEDVVLSWPDAGGTTQIVRRIEDKFRAERYDVDIVFGGGPIFQRMTELAFLEPYKLPEEVLKPIPETVAGQPVYDSEHHWYGAAISTFGLIYSTAVIDAKDLPTPETWEALGHPAYLGLVGVADPTKSGSARKAYEIILQAYGYDEGMALLVRMAANARDFYPGASDIPKQCARGFIALGPCIDFYAQRQKMAPGGEDVAFVAPPGLTVVNVDPIGILKNAAHREVAEAFVEFVMSPEGQRLWMLPPEAEGGPPEIALQRLAVLPSVYEEAREAGAPASMNPYDMPPAEFYDAETERDRLAILPDYMKVAMVDNHAALAKAWKAIVAAGRPQDLEGRLTEPLIGAERMRELGRTVWQPVVIPADAPEAERERLEALREKRLRTKSDLMTRWVGELRKRYERLAEEAREAAGGS